ncbi:MAG: hypothetical protein WC224_01680 [Sphaerochaetaceae bacterium]
MAKNRVLPEKGKRKRKKRSSSQKRFDIAVPTVNEPLPTCVLCGQVIDTIAQAICEGQEGRYSHFDCVLEKLTSQETLGENQKISYVGQGNFAIVEKGEDGYYTLVKKIPYESVSEFQAMQRFVEECKDEK